jgi:hypothetical protein
MGRWLPLWLSWLCETFNEARRTRSHRAFPARVQPAISVEAKKKELIGDFKKASRELRPEHPPLVALPYSPYGVLSFRHPKID